MTQPLYNNNRLHCERISLLVSSQVGREYSPPTPPQRCKPTSKDTIKVILKSANLGNVSCKHGWQNGICCESASWKFAYSAHLQVNATMHSIQGKMYNSTVSFTSPISICLRIRTIKLQKFTEKTTFWQKLPICMVNSGFFPE